MRYVVSAFSALEPALHLLKAEAKRMYMAAGDTDATPAATNCVLRHKLGRYGHGLAPRAQLHTTAPALCCCAGRRLGCNDGPLAAMRAAKWLALVLLVSVALTTARAHRRDNNGNGNGNGNGDNNGYGNGDGNGNSFSKVADWVPTPTPTPPPSLLVPTLPALFAAALTSTVQYSGKPDLDALLDDRATEAPLPASTTLQSAVVPSTRRRVGLGMWIRTVRTSGSRGAEADARWPRVCPRFASTGAAFSRRKMMKAWPCYHGRWCRAETFSSCRPDGTVSTCFCIFRGRSGWQ